MNTITARELFQLAQQHSRPDVAALSVPAVGKAVALDCVVMCEGDLVQLAGALGVKVVHDRRQRRGERPTEPLLFDEGDAE